jgi:hypothetical protein
VARYGRDKRRAGTGALHQVLQINTSSIIEENKETVHHVKSRHIDMQHVSQLVCHTAGVDCGSDIE